MGGPLNYKDDPLSTYQIQELKFMSSPSAPSGPYCVNNLLQDPLSHLKEPIIFKPQQPLPLRQITRGCCLPQVQITLPADGTPVCLRDLNHP